MEPRTRRQNFKATADDDSELNLYTLVGSKLTIRELARRMIVRSSNLATNILIELVTPDIGRERDFFDRLPPDSIDPEVARQYNEYCLAVGLQPREK